MRAKQYAQAWVHPRYAFKPHEKGTSGLSLRTRMLRARSSNTCVRAGGGGSNHSTHVDSQGFGGLDTGRGMGRNSSPPARSLADRRSPVFDAPTAGALAGMRGLS